MGTCFPNEKGLGGRSGNLDVEPDGLEGEGELTWNLPGEEGEGSGEDA